MATCKDCIHYEPCFSGGVSIWNNIEQTEEDHCPHFKNKADFLIENGAIVPPCKVGDTVYLIKDNFIELCEVEGIHYTRRKNYVRIRPFYQEYWGNWSVYYTPSIRSFGKTVFLSIKQAEQKLKERKDKCGK